MKKKLFTAFLFALLAIPSAKGTVLGHSLTLSIAGVAPYAIVGPTTQTAAATWVISIGAGEQLQINVSDAGIVFTLSPTNITHTFANLAVTITDNEDTPHDFTGAAILSSTNVTGIAAGDINGDIDSVTIDLTASTFTKPSPQLIISVPEPGSLMLFTCMILFSHHHRRRKDL